MATLELKTYVLHTKTGESVTTLELADGEEIVSIDSYLGQETTYHVVTRRLLHNDGAHTESAARQRDRDATDEDASDPGEAGQP